MTNYEILKACDIDYIYIWDEHYEETEYVYSIEEIENCIDNFDCFIVHERPKENKIDFFGNLKILGKNNIQIVTVVYREKYKLLNGRY